MEGAHHKKEKRQWKQTEDGERGGNDHRGPFLWFPEHVLLGGGEEG